MLNDSDKRLLEELHSSFLSPLLSVEGVTDIAYNGEAIYFKTNLEGRKKAEIEVGPEEVGAFLRQLANLSEKQFSYLDPILDISFGLYRLNAAFHSVSRVNGRKSYSFSLRIASEEPILENSPSFFPKNSRKILLNALEKRHSIVIGGETGAGKTELQKYLLSHLAESTRVIVIDNVEELELTRSGSLDLTSWLVDERNPKASYSALIKNALRNDPDYLILAESRGEEMLDALNCAMSGRPIITTLHSFDLASIPSRMARMAMMGGKNLGMEALLSDIIHHFQLYVYIGKKVKDGKIFRSIESIGYADEASASVKPIF